MSLEATTALAWKDSFSTKKTMHVKTKMNVKKSQHVPTEAALTLSVDLFVTVNKDSNLSMTVKLVKILTSAQEAHVDLAVVSTHLVDSPVHVITVMKLEIMETAKISMNVLKLDNVKTVTVRTPLVDSSVYVIKVTKKPVMDEFATTSTSVVEKTIHAAREHVKTWMVTSSASVQMDSCQDLMDVKIRMNVKTKPTHADTETV